MYKEDAKVILTKLWPEEVHPTTYGEARGYLVALKKAEMLEEALKFYDHPSWHGPAHNTLIQWEKER